MVVKESFGKDMIEMLLDDLIEAYDTLEKEGVKKVKTGENPTLLY